MLTAISKDAYDCPTSTITSDANWNPGSYLCFW